MERVAGPVMAIAFLAVVGMGIYTYMAASDLAKAKADIAAVAKNRDDFKARLEDVGRKTAAATLALDTCNTQLKEATAKIEASAKKASGRR